jgi:predicted metal-dependent phosphoesterase TrpH
MNLESDTCFYPSGNLFSNSVIMSEQLKSDEYYKFDFHVHSKFSFDSLSKPETIIKTAIRKGLDGLAITDHNSIKGGNKIAKAARDIDENFQIIIGEEVRTSVGDLIGLFLSEEIKKKNIFEVIDEVKAQEGFIILPHPYKSMNDISNELCQKIDAIEIFNGRTSYLLNCKAREFAERNKLLVTGGSDAHFHFEIGNVYDCIPKTIGEITTPDKLKKVLMDKKNKIYGKSGIPYIYLLNLGIKFCKDRKLM